MLKNRESCSKLPTFRSSRSLLGSGFLGGLKGGVIRRLQVLGYEPRVPVLGLELYKRKAMLRAHPPKR